MANNINVTPGAGATVAANNNGGVLYQQVEIVDTTDTTINPAEDETILYLRRLCDLLEGLATTDANNRQRITIDAWTSGVITGLSTTGVNVQPNTGLPPSVGTQIYQPVIVGPIDQRYILADQARNTYANSIRPNLAFA